MVAHTGQPPRLRLPVGVVSWSPARGCSTAEVGASKGLSRRRRTRGPDRGGGEQETFAERRGREMVRDRTERELLDCGTRARVQPEQRAGLVMVKSTHRRVWRPANPSRVPCDRERRAVGAIETAVTPLRTGRTRSSPRRRHRRRPRRCTPRPGWPSDRPRRERLAVEDVADPRLAGLEGEIAADQRRCREPRSRSSALSSFHSDGRNRRAGKATTRARAPRRCGRRAPPLR